MGRSFLGFLEDSHLGEFRGQRIRNRGGLGRGGGGLLQHSVAGRASSASSRPYSFCCAQVFFVVMKWSALKPKPNMQNALWYNIVLTVHRRKTSSSAPLIFTKYEGSDQTDLYAKELRFSTSMFDDHMPWGYNSLFEGGPGILFGENDWLHSRRRWCSQSDQPSADGSRRVREYGFQQRPSWGVEGKLEEKLEENQRHNN